MDRVRRQDPWSLGQPALHDVAKSRDGQEETSAGHGEMAGHAKTAQEADTARQADTPGQEEIGGNDFRGDVTVSQINLDDFIPKEAWLPSPPQKDQPEQPANALQGEATSAEGVDDTNESAAGATAVVVPPQVPSAPNREQEQGDAELARRILMQDRGLRTRYRKG